MSTEKYEFRGADDGGWKTTKSFDWVPLCPDINDVDFRLYMLIRSLLTKYGAVRAITPWELCQLLPSPTRGKPSSITRVRDSIRRLAKVGLLSKPGGEPLRISDRATSQTKPVSIQVNDRPAPGYSGWRNTYDALDDLRKRARRESDAEASEGRDASDSRRDASDSRRDASDSRRDASDSRRAPSAESKRSPAETSDSAEPPSFSSSGSSSSSSSAREGGEPPAEAGEAPEDDEEETQPEQDPKQLAGPEALPGPRAAELEDELAAFVNGLPGGLGPDDVTALTGPVADALAVGWNLPKLREHLTRRVDVTRVRNPASVYRKHLTTNLPAAPAVSRRVFPAGQEHQCQGKAGACGEPVDAEGQACDSCQCADFRCRRLADPRDPDGLCTACAEQQEVYARNSPRRRAAIATG